MTSRENIRCANCSLQIWKFEDLWIHVMTQVAHCDIDPSHGPRFATPNLPPGSPAVNYLSGHDDPTLTDTCPVCGAARKPGDKCASCGQQSSETVHLWDRPTQGAECGDKNAVNIVGMARLADVTCPECLKRAVSAGSEYVDGVMRDLGLGSAALIDSPRINCMKLANLLLAAYSEGMAHPAPFLKCSRCQGGGEDAPGIPCALCKGKGVRQVTIPAAPIEPAAPLLHTASEPLPKGCHCAPGKCMAPVIMGRQMPCRRIAPAAEEPVGFERWWATTDGAGDDARMLKLWCRSAWNASAEEYRKGAKND